MPASLIYFSNTIAYNDAARITGEQNFGVGWNASVFRSGNQYSA